jgi:hypothetical protein
MYLLNRLQYFLQKPWRKFQKQPTKFNTFFNNYLWFLGKMTSFGLYICLTPLRFINAVYYNVWVYGLWSIRDNFADIVNPKTGMISRKRGIIYLFLWIVGFPVRLIKYAGIGIAQLFEGAIFVAIDTVIPALTLYHGTQRESSISISKPGQWKVGSGNFAGSGLYFAIDKNVARHYARNANDSVIIVVRVTLGKCKNLSLAPQDVYRLAGSGNYSGDRITNWGIDNGFNSVEWWREGAKWWEYCMLNKRNGEYVKTAKIRILYIENMQTGNKERVWGGKSLWIF